MKNSNFSNMHKAKLLMIGPTGCGKSFIANFLADAVDSSSNEYRPTRVVRILEFDIPKLNVNGRYVRAEIELWDVSGDFRYERSWPALIRDVHGVIFVCDINDETKISTEMETFYTHFVQKADLKFFQCLVLLNNKPGSNRRANNEIIKLPANAFHHMPQVEINLDEDGNRLRSDFNSFLSTLFNNISEKLEQEEINIMKLQ